MTRGIISTLVVLTLGCATTPAPIQGDVSLPQTFEQVWFRPTIARAGLAVMSDTGTLTVQNRSLEFVGKKDHVSIDVSDIHGVDFRKIGSDFINNWIVVEYGEEGSPSYAVFSSGKGLGWSGGSNKIFSTIQFVTEKSRDAE